MIVDIKRLHPSATTPTNATAGSAGLDLVACIDEPLTLAPGVRPRVSEAILVFASLPNETVMPPAATVIALTYLPSMSAADPIPAVELLLGHPPRFA